MWVENIKLVRNGNLLLHGLTFDSKQPVKHVNLLKVTLLRKINKIQIVTFVLLYYIIYLKELAKTLMLLALSLFLTKGLTFPWYKT